MTHAKSEPSAPAGAPPSEDELRACLVSKNAWFACYPQDFLADIGHLGNTELGIYWRLLLVYYRDGRPLPFEPDRMRRLAMTFNPEEQKTLDHVLVEFFVLSTEPDGSRVWRHRRADAELEIAHKAKAAKSAAAAVTNAKRWGVSHSVAKRVAKRQHSETESESLSGREPQPQPQPQRKKEAPTELADSPLRADPPPPAFDGSNEKAIKPRAVVQIAPTFDLPESWGYDAEALGFPASAVLLESEKFRQYWSVGKGAGKRRSIKGWRQSWSNWLGKAAERVR